MLLTTSCIPLKRLLTTNSTANAAFTSKLPVVATPSGNGVIDLGSNSGTVPNNLLCMPFGAGSNNNVFDMRVYGWKPASLAGNGTVDQWIPMILCEMNCTVSNVCVGPTGGLALTPTDMLADTIVPTTGNANVSTEVLGAADAPAWFQTDLKGCEKIEIVFKVGNITSANTLFTAY